MVTSAPGTPADPKRRAALLGMKLRALVRDHVGHDVDESGVTRPAPFGRGAALRADDAAWILLDEQAERGLGGAIAWAQRTVGDSLDPVGSIDIITESSSGVLARRAELFDLPINVWHAVERLLVPAVVEAYPVRSIDAVHEEFRSVIVDGGAQPIIEHGVLLGEVRGLEVCRAVTDATTGDARLEVGIGAHDREAFLMLHGGRPTVEALADVVAVVEQQRFVGAPYHPLNKLGAERFLRWLSIGAPERIGAKALVEADPPVVRHNLKDAVPCVAVGTTVDDRPLVVVYSTGIDLDLVPFALDARQMHAPDAGLVLVVPARDASPVTVALAAAARNPPELVPWE